jgi:hypothetical protein
MIVALARKLLIALWRMATTGEIPEGVIYFSRRRVFPSRRKMNPSAIRMRLSGSTG